MKFISEFREGALGSGLVRRIERLSRPIRIMEVCGGHTHVICRYGIRDLLPPDIQLIHGPGCPVCVIPQHEIEKAIELSTRPGILLCCFGDVMRVPTRRGTLFSLARGRGSVKMVYSPLEAIEMAAALPDKEIVFFAIGFETTAPSTALALKRASSQGLANFKVLSTHFIIPPALRVLVKDSSSRIGAFIAPGHVTTIIGPDAYCFLADEYNRPVVVTGFEPLDLLQAIMLILQQAAEGKPRVENQYTRAVRVQGNRRALEAMDEVFEIRPAIWRGLGLIPGTGLGIAPAFAPWDAEKAWDLSQVEPAPEPPGCLCGDVLKGVSQPKDCSLFAVSCTPDSPVGPCMVSPEGACAAHYRYRGA